MRDSKVATTGCYAVQAKCEACNWTQTSQEGDRTVRMELRQVLKKFGLPLTGPLFDNAYAYIRENY